MNLIINADLSTTPTEILYFRYITLAAHTNLKLDCLLETEQELKDSYYKFLKQQGCMDFISQIVIPPENQFGVRLDNKLAFPLTVLTKSITSQNVINLLGQIKWLSKIM